MSKKSFDTKTATSKFFTQNTQETQSTPNTPITHDTHDKHSTQDTPTPEQIAAAVLKLQQEPKRGRPPKTEAEKLRGYRYNLNLDRDLQQYLKETAWKNRTSITQYINDLIRADMEAYFKECEEKGIDPREGWEVDEV